MKIVAALLGSALAGQWNGYNHPSGDSEDQFGRTLTPEELDFCGESIPVPNLVNTTCEISGEFVHRYYLTNGAFLLGGNRFTGLEDMSSDGAEAIVYYWQDPNTAVFENNFQMDNTTCFTADVDCQPTGAVTDLALASDNTHYAAGDTILFRFANYKQYSSIVITPQSLTGVPTGVANVTADFGHATSINGNSVTIDIDSTFAMSSQLNVHITTDASSEEAAYVAATDFTGF